jgi:hypothetical protein
MKEATGELNMTVVIVIAVGVLAAFFYTTIWPLISNNYKSNTNCNNAICKCTDGTNKCKMAECYVVDKNGNQDGDSFQCPWKG